MKEGQATRYPIRQLPGTPRFSKLGRLDWVLTSVLVVVAGFGAGLAHLLELGLFQGVVFTTATLLCACWLFAATGSPVGPLTENRGVDLLLSAAFVAALFLSFTDVLDTGSLVPERPLSFSVTALVFLPYGLRSIFELF